MRASIIVAAYNEGEQLLRTVSACHATTGELEHEIILVDDASTDDACERLTGMFPDIVLVRRESRQGPSATKDTGARHACGDTLIFLDAHCKPEEHAIERLVRDVETSDGHAVVMPQIPALDVTNWKNQHHQIGMGYALNLRNLDTRWLGQGELLKRGGFYESPALIGCCFAIGRALYWKLWGFDCDMKYWGVEDIDLGMKAWMLGHPITCDPAATIGHRFQTGFHNYTVPSMHLLANMLRMARKCFCEETWHQWLEQFRKQHSESAWLKAWQAYQKHEESVERERSFLMTHRVRDEFDFAARYKLNWPLDEKENDRSHAGSRSALESPLEFLHAARCTADPPGLDPTRRRLSDASRVASLATPLGTPLDLYLKISRSATGTVFVEDASFICDNNDVEVAAARLLTNLIQGRPLGWVRELTPEAFSRGLRSSWTKQAAKGRAEAVDEVMEKQLEEISNCAFSFLKELLDEL